MIWMIPSLSLRMKREEVEFLKEDCITLLGELAIWISKRKPHGSWMTALLVIPPQRKLFYAWDTRNISGRRFGPWSSQLTWVF